MKIFPRRAFTTVLAAALLLGSVPLQAQAQVARVAVGQTGGMPVSPVSSARTAQAAIAPLSLGAASLAGSLSAPSIAPSIAPAPALSPAPSALSASIHSAPSYDLDGQDENGPAVDAPDAAPVAPKTWRERIAARFGRAPAAVPIEAPSSEAAKAGADLVFDGAIERNGEADAPAVAGSEQAPKRSTGLKAARRDSRDEFGGPLTEPMTLRKSAGFGIKQGLNLVGIGALLDVTLRPLLEVFPWPQYFSDQALAGFGRVALLVNYGPGRIAAALADSPLSFLGAQLPVAVATEEVVYRLFGFGLIFLALAAVKPVSRRLSSIVDVLPNAAGTVGVIKRALRLGDTVSRFAFPLATALSSMTFAAAHFQAWGFSPYVFALNASLGIFLAHTAYKSRGLLAPILAHLGFNLVTMTTILIAMSISTSAGTAFAIIAGLIGVSSLLHDYLSVRKERAFRLTHGAKAAIVLALIGTSMTAFTLATPNRIVRAASVAAAQQEQEHEHQHAPVIFGDSDKIQEALDAIGFSAAPAEPREAMIARIKNSVVNVRVRMEQGMATGSGFILSADGVFITNGHVVGTRKPGEYVEAIVPGVRGAVKAKVLAVNHDKDLAIVQLAKRADGKPWPAVKLAARSPREGEAVTAAGYPRGLPFTVTAGVVSGLDGRGNMYVKHLQTDASINPGNSGGPLFNARGEVVGVNTEIYTQSGGSEGLGFSIMSHEVARVMAQFAKTGNISTASLGIIANLSDPLAPEAGLEIEYVRGGSAAEKAGLQRGDLIIAVGKESIEEGGQEAAGHVAYALSRMSPGEETTIVVLRDDSPITLPLTADAKVTEAPRH